jgi:hypothetical protein
MIVLAGQVYRAKAPRGWRYVRVTQVRGEVAHCREILPSGRNALGWLRGVPRAVPMRVVLEWHEGELRMPARYEHVR